MCTLPTVRSAVVASTEVVGEDACPLFAMNVSMLIVLGVYQVWILVPYHVRALSVVHHGIGRV